MRDTTFTAYLTQVLKQREEVTQTLCAMEDPATGPVSQTTIDYVLLVTQLNAIGDSLSRIAEKLAKR